MYAPADLMPAARLPLHGGIEGDWWLAWNSDPQVILPALLLGFWYFRGARRMRPEHHSRTRSTLFVVGLTVMLLAMQSPLDRLGEHLFAFHMVQHELFILVGVPLMLLGAPTVPVLRGMPREVRRPLARVVFRSRVWKLVARALTFPLIAIAQMTVLLFAWHFAPGWFDAALRNDVIHDIQHISFILAAVVFWWNVIDPWPLHSRIPYGGRMLYIPVMMAPRVLLSAMLVFADDAYYRAYQEVRPIFAITPLDDQVLGGLIMWVPGESMHLIAIGIVFAVWYRKSRAQERAEGAALLASRAREGASL